MGTTIRTQTSVNRGTKRRRKAHQQRRRRTSKHILKPKEKDAEEGKLTSTSSKQERNAKNPKAVKDPGDVNGYLISWKKQQSGEDVSWKFNKNTQSWLIRHMYESDKVPKAAFAVLLDYLNGLKSGETKRRMLVDATRRALRYKDHEKSSENTVEDASAEGEIADVKKPWGSVGTAATSKRADMSKGELDVQNEDTARWLKLNEHDKRKEYKRARKILESFST